MPVSFSSNVILAKALAMYGHCLKPQNYKDLLACHSVSFLLLTERFPPFLH